jgi:hypothetical protein
MVFDDIELVDNKKSNCLRMILYALPYLVDFKLVISDEPNTAFFRPLARLQRPKSGFFATLDEIFSKLAPQITLVRKMAIASRFTIVGTAN